MRGPRTATEGRDATDAVLNAPADAFTTLVMGSKAGELRHW
ncbi:hypothetical protein [Streptomyces sp. NPDC007346]